MTKGSLKSNFMHQSAWQLLLVLTPIVTTPYLSRVLGAEQVGVFSFTYAITQYFVLFAALGISTYGVRAIALCGKDRAKRSNVFWNTYGSQLLVGIVVALAYVFYIALWPQGGFLVSAVWGLWVVSALADISWLFFGVEEFKVPTIRSIATKLLSIVVIFVFVKGPEDLWIYCTAIAGSFFINQLLLWPFIRRYVDFVRPSFPEIARHLLPSFRLFIPVIAISLYVTLDKLMLGAMSGMTQTGYFEYSEKLSKLPMALIAAMGSVMLPRMTSKLVEGRKDEALLLLEDSVWVMLAIAFALMFGIIAIAPEFAPVFLGEEFSSCSDIMTVIAITVPIISITNVLGRQYLLPLQRDNLFTASVCVGAVVNIILNLFLIPPFAALGAAISSVFAEVSVLLVQVCITHKELPIKRYLKNSIPFVVCGLTMYFAVRQVASLCNAMWGFSVQGLIMEIIVGIFVFVVLALIWCLLTRDEHFRKAIRR